MTPRGPGGDSLALQQEMYPLVHGLGTHCPLAQQPCSWELLTGPGPRDNVVPSPGSPPAVRPHSLMSTAPKGLGDRPWVGSVVGNGDRDGGWEAVLSEPTFGKRA